MLKRIFILCSVLVSGVSHAQIAAQKQHVAEQMPSNIYGSVEIRHHLNTYFDTEGYRGVQEPSTHVRLQAGIQLYNRNLDLYATVGVYKRPNTQQILQRRPEIAMDLYLLKTPSIQLMQYNIVQVPFEQQDKDLEFEASETDSGSVYTVGLAPTFFHSINVADSSIKFKIGVDGWTRMYTRKKYVEGEVSADNGRREDGYSIVSIVDKNGEPIEDTANHYDLLSLAGFEIQPGFLSDFTIDASVNYTRKFRPKYEINEANNIDYKYGVDDRSYYQIRGKYKLTEKLTLINDFYHFHGGFFASDRDGENRRFRNIARITCAL